MKLKILKKAILSKLGCQNTVIIIKIPADFFGGLCQSLLPDSKMFRKIKRQIIAKIIVKINNKGSFPLLYTGVIKTTILNTVGYWCKKKKKKKKKKALETWVVKSYQNGVTVVNTPDIQQREKET